MKNDFVYSTKSKDTVSKVGGRGYMITKVKVKVTLEQATKAQSGSRGIALLFL